MNALTRKSGFGTNGARICAATVLIAGGVGTAHAVDMTAGDWKFTANGNVNVHYINSTCEDSAPPISLGFACRVDSGGVQHSSSVSNGLLPAALVLGASTTQNGYDLAVVFGFYPGISTNDASPNLQQGASQLNTALGTTAIDMRQVYLTAGNEHMGTFLLGRNIGLFGADAILNDMTLPGVGVGGGNYSAPANTSLGSIGFGYIYTDWLAQMDYTTPDLAGFKITVGIFDPLEPIGQAAPTAKSAPGFHGKLAFTHDWLYLSASFLAQKQEGVNNIGDYDSKAFDVGGKVTFGGAEFLAWYYSGTGVGTTALFLGGATGAGDERDSDGFLAQFTYKFGDLKLGINYGESNLDLASGETATPPLTVPLTAPLVETNKKYTVGAYYSLTKNFTLLTEYTDTRAESHNGIKNDSSNFNIGAYMSF